MTRTMYDAVTAANVPAGATLVAGYGDGYYQNVAAFRARFPGATVVEIAVFAHDDLGQVLDVETGDATPAQAPGWVQMRRAAGVDPTVYCDTSTWPAVRSAFQSAGVAEPHYWIAQYDNNPTIPAGAIAKQYQDPGPYDLSSVADYWPGVDPTPEDDVTPDDLLNARLPALPGGYVPSVSDALHGAASADDKIDGLPAALLSAPMPAYAGIPDGKGGTYIPTVGECINGAKQAGTQIAALGQQVTALSAAVTTLATQLTAAHPGVDTATVVAAVQAAIAAAVVHVDVQVAGPTPTPSS
ncbi:hypothetical protein ABH930_000342 [Kitasatospora sp. GAS204A]|uniref:hypothetical protein n=1 Tax=unclassified Kitasatospora TaxID=2633591 RepID=UPI0024761A54|nr:hypothetical protein [Kitasatospora sp. GAS204B]MDH6116923.1 hypothetical protein [Kitasatospora sp. GAS204B]